jgi:signal transduction histidine kinase
LLDTFVAIFTIILLCSILFGIISGILFSNQILKPLRNLSNAINKITSGESKERISAGQSKDELSVLIQQFNLMLDQIDKKDRSMRETLDIVSHELRTPMTRFKVMAEYALSKGEDLETTKDSIRELIEGADEILAEFKMIADITTMESGIKKLDLKEISINKLVEEVIDLYGIVADQKHVEIIFSPKEDIHLLVDHRKLRQALANIVDNSIKYSPENKSIIIEVAKINHATEIHITDQGIGIATHEIPLIFNRLYRGENSRHEKGMGLGLSLANLIVAAHAGKIEVISQLGRGTTFIISLPMSS